MFFTYIFSFTYHKALLPTFLSTELRKIKQVTQDDKSRKYVNAPNRVLPVPVKLRSYSSHELASY